MVKILNVLLPVHRGDDGSYIIDIFFLSLVFSLCPLFDFKLLFNC